MSMARCSSRKVSSWALSGSSITSSAKVVGWFDMPGSMPRGAQRRTGTPYVVVRSRTGRSMPARDLGELGDGLGGAVLGAGHPGDGLLHQGAADVVGAGAEHRPGAVDAELHPGRLDVVDPAVQHDPRHRVDGEVVAQRRAGAGDAGEVDRRGRVHERQRHELGEAAGLVLDPAEDAQVLDPVPGVVDVAVHHRRARPQPDAVRGGDDLDPGGGGQLALGEDPADLVVEDLRGGAGDGAEPGLAGLDQEVLERQPGPGGAVDDLHRAERVHVHLGHPLLHRGGEVEVRRTGELGVDAALHADLGRAELPGLLGAVGDLLQRQRVGVGVGAALGERAEPAADVADVGEVDVPVDDVGHVVADGLPAQRVGELHDLVEQLALRGHQRQRVLVGQVPRVALGRRERRAPLPGYSLDDSSPLDRPISGPVRQGLSP